MDTAGRQLSCVGGSFGVLVPTDVMLCGEMSIVWALRAPRNLADQGRINTLVEVSSW